MWPYANYLNLGTLIFATSVLLFSQRFPAGVEMSGAAASKNGEIFSCDFEVFGIVQGVFFRKHTQKKATELGLRGWCRNTNDGSVAGQMEGNSTAINEMQYWLQKTGSPQSRIDKAVLSKPKPIEEFSFPDFAIRR